MFIDTLETHWGKFINVFHWKEQLDTPFVSDVSKFNLLFEPLTAQSICEKYESSFGEQIPESLLEFYTYTNGCRLFSNSLCIYGFQQYCDETFEPFDLIKENEKLSFKFSKASTDYICFGSLGGQYLFCFPKKSKQKVIVFDADKMKKTKEFDDFSSCFKTVFNNLLDEYDSNGRKKHISKQYRNIPVLANLTFDKKFLEE